VVDDEGDFWADHDEDCHGMIDTEEMRREFPEGFSYPCCGQDGTAAGCTRGMHRAADDKRWRDEVELYSETENQEVEKSEDEDKTTEDEGVADGEKGRRKE